MLGEQRVKEGTGEEVDASVAAGRGIKQYPGSCVRERRLKTVKTPKAGEITGE